MKKVRKILPLSLYDIPGIEAWLEEQANAGLFPVFVNSWVTFTKDGVPGTRFRLVVNEGKEDAPPREQRELFENAGWKYACSIAGAYFLFYTTDPEAVEVYSDWESRGFALEPLKKRLASRRRSILRIYAVLAAVAIWVLFFFESKYDVQPDHFSQLAWLPLELFRPTILLFLICAVWSWRQALRDRRLLRQIDQALSLGMPPPSQGPSKAIARSQIAALVVTPLLVAALIINRFDSLNPWSMIPLERFSDPYIAIQSIEREPVFPWKELFEPIPGFEQNVESRKNVFNEKFGNYAEKRFSLLAPVWYSVTQKAYSPQSGSKENYFSPKPENGVERYTPDLDATYLHLLIPALSRPVARAQMDDYRPVNVKWSYEDLTCPGLDFAILATEPENVMQMLAIGKGGRVAVFRYAGKEQLSAHLQELSEVVN